MCILFLFFRRKYYTVDQVPNKTLDLHENRSSLNSVENVDVESGQSIIDCNNYFPNATQLTFNDILPATGTSVATTLGRIVSLKQLKKLVNGCNHFSFRKLITI